MREDHFTNTVEGAAAYEQLRGRDAHNDDRPTRRELDADERAERAEVERERNDEWWSE